LTILLANLQLKGMEHISCLAGWVHANPGRGGRLARLGRAGTVLFAGMLVLSQPSGMAGAKGPSSRFLRVTPSAVVVRIGESVSFTVVDEGGAPVADAQWTLSERVAEMEAATVDAIGGTTFRAKFAGRAVLTAFLGDLSATATVRVVDRKDQLDATLLWSLDPWPGYEALTMRQGTGAGQGPDFFAVEWNGVSPAIVRGLRNDGRQMWLAHLTSMASPTSLKLRDSPISGKLYLAGKELSGVRELLLGEDNTAFLGSHSGNAGIDLRAGEKALFVRDSGDGGGGLLFLERGATSDALVDIRGIDGHETWRFNSTGRLAANWTVNYEGDIGVVETLNNPPSSSLLVLNGQNGVIRFRIPFPNSSSQVQNFKCVDGNNLLNVRASRAGSVFTSSDGNMYVQVEVLNESTRSGCGSQQGSHAFENTLSLLEVNPEGVASWHEFEQIHSDGNGNFRAQERAFAGESIPDGLGGVLAAWTYFFPGVKGGEKPRSETRLSRIGPSEQRDFTLPMTYWTPGLTGLFDRNMVLGEGNVLYATNGRALVSFQIVSGEIKWVRQPPTGEIEIHHTTAGGGILVSNQGHLTYFDAEGGGVNLPWTAETAGNGSEVGLVQTDPVTHASAPVLSLREVELYSSGHFIAVEAGTPTNPGRFVMFQAH
jgi:hypothetical protein